MKKTYHSVFITAYILIILTGIMWQAGGVSAQDTIKLTVNSYTSSTATMSNMKPGDEMNSEYTIINEGQEGFQYFVDFKFISGDVELYDILLMTLEKEGDIIYSGLMSEAAGRIAVGTLAGGDESRLRMDVTFPWEAGNEYQGKATTVAFEFSASGEPGPTAQPSPSPASTATAPPTSEPTPSATETGGIPTFEPTATPDNTVTPTPKASATATPTTTPTNSQGAIATPAQSISPTASPRTTDSPTLVDGISITEEPVPMGGISNPTAAPDAGGQDSSSTPAPAQETTLPDDEIPLGAPEEGSPLPNTAEPWYNLILASLAVAILSVIIMRRLKSKK